MSKMCQGGWVDGQPTASYNVERRGNVTFLFSSSSEITGVQSNDSLYFVCVFKRSWARLIFSVELCPIVISRMTGFGSSTCLSVTWNNIIFPRRLSNSSFSPLKKKPNQFLAGKKKRSGCGDTSYKDQCSSFLYHTTRVHLMEIYKLCIAPI